MGAGGWDKGVRSWTSDGSREEGKAMVDNML